jgi:uncharacterized protein (DUF58 family)
MQTLSSEVMRKIKEIEMYTQRLLSGCLAGDARSAQKGIGFEFDQLREYQPGDDVRFIDWRGSARSNSLLVKQYIEERSRTVLIAVDVSGSSFFSSDELLRNELFAQIASMLALVAHYGKDRAGLILFSDAVECFIPPAQGLLHARNIMQTLFTHKPSGRQTNINAALQRILKVRRKDSIVFLLSDFISTRFEQQLRSVALLNELIAVRYLDINEKRLPSVGFITIEDIETDSAYLVDMRSAGAATLNQFLTERLDSQNKLFRKYGIDVLDVAGNKQFMSDIVKFFRRRMRY